MQRLLTHTVLIAFMLGAWAYAQQANPDQRSRDLEARELAIPFKGITANGQVEAGLFGTGKTGVLLLPVIGALLAIAVPPKRYRAVLSERDTWVIMLVYSITFGGFVGIQSILAMQYAVLGGVGLMGGPLAGSGVAPGTISQQIFSFIGSDVAVYLSIIGGVGLLILLTYIPDGLAALNERTAAHCEPGVAQYVSHGGVQQSE